MENSTETCYQTVRVLVNSYGQKIVVNPFATTITPQKIAPKPPSEGYSIHCSDCALNFDSLEEFEHHNLTMHSQRKQITCEICNATFRRRDHLKRHMQCLHADKPPCRCPVCGIDFKLQDILLNHIKKNHPNKSVGFRCNQCEYQSQNLSELEKHASTHLLVERQRHICPHCDTSFKRRDHMLRHVKSQHLMQNVVCPLCGQVYKRKDHVARHMREKHARNTLPES